MKYGKVITTTASVYTQAETLNITPRGIIPSLCPPSSEDLRRSFTLLSITAYRRRAKWNFDIVHARGIGVTYLTIALKTRAIYLYYCTLPPMFRINLLLRKTYLFQISHKCIIYSCTFVLNNIFINWKLTMIRYFSLFKNINLSDLKIYEDLRKSFPMTI